MAQLSRDSEKRVLTKTRASPERGSILQFFRRILSLLGIISKLEPQVVNRNHPKKSCILVGQISGCFPLLLYPVCVVDLEFPCGTQLAQEDTFCLCWPLLVPSFVPCSSFPHFHTHTLFPYLLLSHHLPFLPSCSLSIRGFQW